MAEALGTLIFLGLEAAGVVAAGTGATTIIAGLTVATAVGTLAVVGISAAVAFSTQPQVPSAGDGSQPIRQAIPPRLFGYGRTRIAGAYMLFEAVPTSEDSIDVLALHQGRIGQIVHIYLNDDIVALDVDGDVTAVLNASDDGRYASDNVRIATRLGLATETAHALATAVLPTLWTSAHRGDGVSSLAIRCSDVAVDAIQRRYPRGLPKPSVVGDLAPVWDPREPGHDRDDEDTWAVSRNPVVQLIDFLTHTDRGLGFDYDAVIAPNIARWVAIADMCDETVAKADGASEPRYRSDGWAFLTTDPAEVVGAILATFDGWLAEDGNGALTLYGGQYEPPDVELNDDHITGLTIHKGVEDEELVNEVQFTYTAPGANWRDAPGVSLRDEAAISELGRVRSQRLQLPWVQSHSQGRRLAKRLLARHQATTRGKLVTNLYGLKVLGKRWVKVRSRRVPDLADAVIEIGNVKIDLANARLVFDWVSVNTNEIDAWDAATEEGTPPNYASVLANVTAADAGAGNEINVEFDAIDPAQEWLRFVIDYRTGGGAWTREVLDDGDVIELGGGRSRLQTAAVASGTWDVRIATVNWQGTTAGAAPIVDPDLVWAPGVDGTSVVIS